MAGVQLGVGSSVLTQLGVWEMPDAGLGLDDQQGQGPSQIPTGEVNEFWEEVACVPENCPQTNIQASPRHGPTTKGQGLPSFDGNPDHDTF